LAIACLGGSIGWIAAIDSLSQGFHDFSTFLGRHISSFDRLANFRAQELQGRLIWIDSAKWIRTGSIGARDARL
jgi:hypothetical protein